MKHGNSIVYLPTLPLNFWEKDEEFQRKNRENNFSNIVPLSTIRSSSSNNNLFNSLDKKPLSTSNSPKLIRIRNKNNPEIPIPIKKPISLLFSESNFSPDNNLFNSSNKKDTSKCNCPLCTIFRNDNGPIKPIEPIPFKRPLYTNNNLFNSLDEKPSSGCNCPKLTRLRNKNKLEILFSESSSASKNNLFKSSKEKSRLSLRRNNKTDKPLSDPKYIRDKPKIRIINPFGIDPGYILEEIDINEAFGVKPKGIRDKKKRKYRNIIIFD